jgi:malate/lactate dehydrogenase
MKIGIVGCGMVGLASAFSLVMAGVGREIVLVDLNHARAEAEANDIYHAVPFAHPLTARAGDYPDLTGAWVVVIAGGVSQKHITMALPYLAGGEGALATIPLSLNSSEQEQLRRSVGRLREAISLISSCEPETRQKAK